MSTIRLPRLLAETTNANVSHNVTGGTVAEAFDDLFSGLPGLRNHLLDETGALRPHVSVFVDGHQADLVSEVGGEADIRILHAVSGGRSDSALSRLI